MRPTRLTRLVRVEAQERQQAEPRETILVRVVYIDTLGIEPPLEGPVYEYEMPLPRPGDRPC
jgi:hypothetical protein